MNDSNGHVEAILHIKVVNDTDIRTYKLKVQNTVGENSRDIQLVEGKFELYVKGSDKLILYLFSLLI